MISTYFADLHIHIGRDIYDQPVKITASNRLTLTNILEEASRRKGIDMIGVIDCQSPAVQQEIIQLIEEKKAYELSDGGIAFENVTLILGAEIEVYDENCKGPLHVLVYLPTLTSMAAFTKWLTGRMKNVTLSSQRYYGTAKELQYKVKELDGLFVPAHVFTPFKSVYGKGVTKSLTEVFDPDLIDAIELGLSSDTHMADQISELGTYTFLTNSDSHSLAKIGREYQQIRMETPSFRELYYALHAVEGRGVAVNYGMNPKLGKYYTTVCQKCMAPLPYRTVSCTHCSSKKVINGVFDRISELKNRDDEEPERPPYLYQVPLEYLPGLGPKTFEKLLERFGLEMTILHESKLDELKEVVPERLATAIIDMRHGKLKVEAGGGGRYGRVVSSKK